jgi:hypothetical protein
VCYAQLDVKGTEGMENQSTRYCKSIVCLQEGKCHTLRFASKNRRKKRFFDANLDPRSVMLMVAAKLIE